MKKLKVITVFGTRPEIIRLSRILPHMDTYFDHVQVYTSQSYDRELSDVFFQDLDLRKPDYILQVKADTIGKQIANIISLTEEVFIKEKPDALLVLGDTNSALSAIVAKRLKIPIFHMEAGNRSFDEDVPEEINRRIVDHISDFNLPYTEHSRRYLIQEGIHPKTIIVTGTPLAEVFDYFKEKVDQSTILKKLKLTPQKYFLVSTHREENVDRKENLKELVDSLNFLAKRYKMPVIISLHPRTKKRIQEFGLFFDSLVRPLKPFGYVDYNKLQKNAACVLSDSGTIQEESVLLQFPAIQIRKSTERPEAFDAGSIILIGFNKDAIVQAVEMAQNFSKHENRSIPHEYVDTNTSEKVVKFIQGMTSIKKFHS